MVSVDHRLTKCRMLSATLGRPTMIAAADGVSLPFPSEVDEEVFQSGSESADLTSQSSITFFVLSIKLFELVQRILLALYFNNPVGPSSNSSQYFTDADSVLNIDNDMLIWLKGVPSHLLLDDDGLSRYSRHTASTFRRQAAVLKIRYLQARIYLFRPLLSQTCVMHRNATSDGRDDPSQTTFATNLHYRVAIQCSLLCVKEAIDLIETMHTNHTTAETWGKKPSWLYGVLHIYLAATVLLAARLAPDLLLTEISNEKFEATWNKALAILREFQADSVSAHRCVSALETLYRKLPVGSGHTTTSQDSQSHTLAAFRGAEENDAAYVVTALPTAPSDSWVTGSQEPLLDWIPSFDLSDPNDMSWFMTSESFA